MNSCKTQKRQKQKQRQNKSKNKSKKTKGGYISNKKPTRTMVTKPATKRSIKTSLKSTKQPQSPVSNALLLPKIMNTF